jgi:N-acetylglucosamine malate deacetylase 2
MTFLSPTASRKRPAADARSLPRAGRVLAVTARPGQESAELGGLLFAFRRAGASLGVLSLTRGEASPLNSSLARLEAIRPWELQLAASVLGVSWVAVASYPDGALDRQPVGELTERVLRAVRQYQANLLLVIDPAAGDPDDGAVAAAVWSAARQAGVPAMACTRPGARGARVIDLGADAATARTIAKAAAAAHASQSEGLSGLTRRLDLLDNREHVRWLVARNQRGAGRRHDEAA